MSMTKRYLHSLPQAEQDAILGAVNPDEWIEDAENEPTDEELAEWARALMEEDEEPIYELKPGLARCKHIMRTSGHQCQLALGHGGRHAWEPSWVARVQEIESAERDEAQLVKPQPVGVKLDGYDI